MYVKTRSGFTEADREFIAGTLGATEAERADLLFRSADPATVTPLLRNGALFERSMTRPPDFLQISTGLFFYLFVYRALDRRGIAGDDVVDYVAAVCTEFRSTSGLLQVASRQGAFFYMTDMLELVEELDGPTRHLMRKYIGDVTLFLTGFFPGFFARRTERHGAPAIGYYQEVARSQYSDAALDPDARDDQTAGVLWVLAERFGEVRESLSELAGQCRLTQAGIRPAT